MPGPVLKNQSSGESCAGDGRASGPEPAQVREIAYKLSAVVATDPRTEKISFDWIEPQRTLRMRVDQDQARLLGVSSQVLAQALSVVVSGINVVSDLQP